MFLVLLFSAIANLLTKETATIGAWASRRRFWRVFMVTERINLRRRRGTAARTSGAVQPRVDRQRLTELISGSASRIASWSRSVRRRMFMLEKALAETDPETTDVVVMTAKIAQRMRLRCFAVRS